jgi:hypothetical protein
MAETRPAITKPNALAILRRLSAVTSTLPGLDAALMIPQYSAPVVIFLLLKLANLRAFHKQLSMQSQQSLITLAGGLAKGAASLGEARTAMRLFGEWTLNPGSGTHSAIVAAEPRETYGGDTVEKYDAVQEELTKRTLTNVLLALCPSPKTPRFTPVFLDLASQGKPIWRKVHLDYPMPLVDWVLRSRAHSLVVE